HLCSAGHQPGVCARMISRSRRGGIGRIFHAPRLLNSFRSSGAGWRLPRASPSVENVVNECVSEVDLGHKRSMVNHRPTKWYMASLPPELVGDCSGKYARVKIWPTFENGAMVSPPPPI